LRQDGENSTGSSSPPRTALPLRRSVRYSHLNPEYLRTAASKLDEVFTDPLTLGQGDPK
jgi:hypothetical protein